MRACAAFHMYNQPERLNVIPSAKHLLNIVLFLLSLTVYSSIFEFLTLRAKSGGRLVSSTPSTGIAEPGRGAWPAG
jgi:hypothetical protein